MTLAHHNSDAGHFPLSELQRAYLIGRQKGVVMGGIGCQVYVELETPRLEVDRLEQAWHSLVERHDILRLVIDGKRGQRVLPEVPQVPLPIHDLRTATKADANAKLTDLRRDTARQTFDPARWPLFDIRLVRETDGDRLTFCFDLIAADAATVHYLINELSRIYRGATPMTISEVTYREARLAQSSTARRYAQAQSYWQKALPTLPTGPELPYAIDPASLEEPHFKRLLTRLDQDRADALSLKCKVHGTTLPTVLNAAFAQVIAAWSRQRRFLLNMPIFVPALRDSDKRAPLGNFTSNVLVDADCTSATFEEDLRNISKSVRNSLRHRDYSGLSVMRDLRNSRGSQTSNGLIAPVILTNLLAHKHAVNWTGLLGRLTGGVSRTPQVSLDHQIMQADDGIAFHWDFVEDLFAPNLIQHMAKAHLDLINTLAESDGAWQMPVHCAPQAHLETRAQQNITQQEVVPKRLHDGFFERAVGEPDAIAMIEGDVQASYAVLADRAHGVHAQLRDAGVERGASVAVILPPGIEHSTAILGVLAAGGCFVPLDPRTPDTRRVRELELLAPQVIITTPKIAAGLPPNTPATVIHPSGVAAPRALAASDPSDTAYIIFTSGTTGDPKGVMISHSAAHGTCADLIARYELDANTRVLALSEPTFDLSIFDHFAIWACGGTVVHPAAAQRGDPSSWLDSIERYNVNLWNSVPALMDLIVHVAQRSGRRLPALSRVMLSGDWIPPKLPQAIRTLAPNAAIESLGGATEAGIWSVRHEIVHEDFKATSIPYGVPLVNQSLHVLDCRLSPRPNNVEGALYIGGAGLALGYLGQPELTANAFVTHPISGQRLYRTGDLAKYREDGEVILIGREDAQVKIQGLRVELGDVTQALLEVPEIEQVRVDAIGSKFENKRLVAFATPRVKIAALQSDSPLDIQSTIDSALSFVPEDPAGLYQSICMRHSPRGFREDTVSFADIQKLLKVFIECSVHGQKKRVYPSANSLYPVQAFLSVEPDRVSGIAGGLYAVHPSGTLSLVSSKQMEGPQLHFLPNRALAASAPFTILLFARNDTHEGRFGNLPDNQFLLEAGYIGQALTRASLDTPLRLCPIDSMDPTAAAQAAGFVPKDFLHAFVGGIPDQPTDIPTPSNPNLIAALRSAAEAQLPAYLRPHDYIIVDSFPVTGNGKIDRIALAGLAEQAIKQRTDTTLKVSTELELVLLEKCREVLGLDHIDLTTEFYAMGADSLRLVELAGVIEEKFQVELDIAEVFEYPTIHAIAELITSRQP